MTNRLRLVATISLVAIFNDGHARAELKVGVARRVITPDPLLPVSGGLGPTAPVREKRGDLTARAIVFQQADTTVAVVSLDLLGFPSVLCDRVRSRVPRIPARNILIGSTHAHSAPDCYAFPDGRGGHTGDLAYMDFVCKQTAEALNAAFDQLRPGRLKVATDEARGKIAYNYYAPDLYDRRMSVIQALSPNGDTIATLVNYAVHPEVLGPGVGLLSPDLVGPLCDRIEAQAGGMGIFMNSAQGGMITADNRDLDKPKDPQRGYWHDSRTWDECLRIGYTMADEALRIVRDAPVQDQPTVFCGSIDVKFPVDNDVLWNVILGSPLKYPRNPDRSISTRINVVNLGNAQILTIPGEALPNIGFYLKRKMHGEHNLLFGLTNDAFGYILTKVDFQSFPRYTYVSRTSLGEMTGEILIEQSLSFVDDCPKPDRIGRQPRTGLPARPAPNATPVEVASDTAVTEPPRHAAELVFPLHAQHNHAPGIVECPNGDLLVSWYRGSGERSADDVAVYGARRRAGSATWSEAFLLADRPGFPDCNTCLMIDSRDRLWLFWPTILANSWESCLTNFRVASRYTDDGAPRWEREGLVLLKPDDFRDTAVQRLDEWLTRFNIPLPAATQAKLDETRHRLGDKLYQRLGWQPRCKPTVLPNGRILLPLYTDTFSMSIMAISDDGGESWFASKPLIGVGNIQPTVLRRNDGELVAYMRENGPLDRVRVSESRDDGLTWAAVGVAELPNPGSGLDGIRLANGHWLLIYNDTTQGRNRLAVSVSVDEGRTWKWTRHLENETAGSFHYPAVIQGRDGTIHAVYSYFVSGGKSMKHAALNEAWITSAPK
jgi:predicted neuraminidase